MAEGRARDLDLSVDVVAIVTSHLQATEAGQAARDLEDHALEARDPQLGARGSPPLSPTAPPPLSLTPPLATLGEPAVGGWLGLCSRPTCDLWASVSPPGPPPLFPQNETDLTVAKEALRDLARDLSDPIR